MREGAKKKKSITLNSLYLGCGKHLGSFYSRPDAGISHIDAHLHTHILIHTHTYRYCPNCLSVIHMYAHSIS